MISYKLFICCLLCRRLSQDLAKDLAILAQEIHNVAGDGETPTNASDAVEPSSASKEVTSGFSLYICRIFVELF